MNNCEYCKETIAKANDENEIRLNSAKYIACPKCFDYICDMIHLIPKYHIEIYDVACDKEYLYLRGEKKK